MKYLTTAEFNQRIAAILGRERAVAPPEAQQPRAKPATEPRRPISSPTQAKARAIVRGRLAGMTRRVLHRPDLGPCLEWQGYRAKKGYGYLGGVPIYRLIWIAANGEIDDRPMVVCHRCDNPPCMRLAHLFLGTHADNARDCIEKQRHITSRTAHPIDSRSKFPVRVASIRNAFELERIPESQAWSPFRYIRKRRALGCGPKRFDPSALRAALATIRACDASKKVGV